MDRMDSNTPKLIADRRRTVGELDLAAETGIAADIERIAAASRRRTAQIEQSHEAVQRLRGGSD